MYVDSYLSKNRVSIEEYNVLGLSALQIAMKIEEVDIVSMNPSAYPYSQEFTLVQYEKKIVQSLNFKLLPDPLYSWVDLLIDYWDNYLANQKLKSNM